MSGHSKWATIRHKKGAADAKRGKMFSKLAKEMMVVARQGGGDPESNPTLRTLLQKAKGVNMPNDNIERAIKKGTGELGAETYEEITYEGYASGGVGLIVKVLTDNRNRAAAEIRHIFNKHGSSFASLGAVSRGFDRRGQILVDASKVAEDRLMEIALEAGADDLQNDGEHFEILTTPQQFADVSEALENAGIDVENAEVALIPTTPMPVADIAVARSVLRFVSDLEDQDDVQEVFTNMDIDDAILDKLETE